MSAFITPFLPLHRPRHSHHVTPLMSVRGSQTNPYKIAVLEGDGAGPSVADATIKILGELTNYAEIHFDFVKAPYGADAYEKSGKLITEETIDVCRSADAVLRSYQGMERGVGKNASAHLQLTDRLGLFAQFRPVVVYPALSSQSTLRDDVVQNLDIMLVREISAGALGPNVSRGEEVAQISEISYKEEQIDAIATAALDMAERRSGRILNVDKADVMAVSRFWRSRLHQIIEKQENAGVVLSDMYVDDFVREVILRPSQFDVVVTSNLFGDILAEVIAALAGPQRTSPSLWVSRDGLGIYGPADIYNATAYPRGGEMNPVALIRAASMMLRYALDEPAAADTIQQALRKSMEDVAGRWGSNGTGMETGEWADVVGRSLQLMRQYEQVCDPTECGE